MDKFDEFLESLKETKSNEKLSEGFKENLVKKMDEEYSKTRKDRFKDFVNKFKSNSLSFSQKFAIVFSLFIIISGVAFGKNIVDWAKEVFSNQDKSVDLAIENGYYQNIDMDYIYHDGVGIKVDYLYCDEASLYIIVFNIKTKEEYDEIYFDKIELNGNDKKIYDINSKEVFYNRDIRRVTKHETLLFTKFHTLNTDFMNIDFLDIIINNIVLEKSNNQILINDTWRFNINIDKHVNIQENEYLIHSEDFIDKYDIKFKNYNLYVMLKFKDIEINQYDLNIESIYVEDEYGKRYNCRNMSFINDKELKLIISIDDNTKKNLKLVINYINNSNKRENIILYLSEDLASV